MFVCDPNRRRVGDSEEVETLDLSVVALHWRMQSCCASGPFSTVYEPTLVSEVSGYRTYHVLQNGIPLRINVAGSEPRTVHT